VHMATPRPMRRHMSLRYGVALGVGVGVWVGVGSGCGCGCEWGVCWRVWGWDWLEVAGGFVMGSGLWCMEQELGWKVVVIVCMVLMWSCV
jgi:hypothetical protein